MEQYTVTGMSCAACSSRVEKAVSKVSGVTSCSVSLLTNSMGVEGTASQSEIIAAVEAAGYGASVKGADAGAKKGAAMAEDALKEGCPERQGDTDYEASSDRITVFSDSTDVHFHGSYDVELAIAGISG
ncbi:MAG: hypothetical protein BHW14_01145 [Coprococcus sp. 43_8]|nr:MAG: hypothetical protein BHW14_01145 [Coprococcus sp. 43_8]